MEELLEALVRGERRPHPDARRPRELRRRLLAEPAEELGSPFEVSATGRSSECHEAERQPDDDRVDAGLRQSKPGSDAHRYADDACPDPDPYQHRDEREKRTCEEEGE